MLVLTQIVRVIVIRRHRKSSIVARNTRILRVCLHVTPLDDLASSSGKLSLEWLHVWLLLVITTELLLLLLLLLHVWEHIRRRLFSFIVVEDICWVGELYCALLTFEWLPLLVGNLLLVHWWVAHRCPLLLRLVLIHYVTALYWMSLNTASHSYN